jgi:protein-disulfide isomerase
VEAARVAIALQMQERGAARYLEFHSRLLAGPGRADKARALAVAAGLGIDMARLEADLARPEIEATLGEGRKLARALRIRGTPSYVVCDRILAGFLGGGPLKGIIDAARQAQRDSGTHCEV